MTDTPQDLPLSGRIVGITADRRWQEQAGLFAKRGAEVMHGPTLRTIDLSRDENLRATTEKLIARPPDFAVATTGMGMKYWLSAAAEWGRAEALLAALARARIVARGAKSAAAVKGAGLDVWWQAPTERMADIIDRFAAERAGSARVALQLFDPDDPSTGALRRIVGELVEVPVYRWLLPTDPGPAERLIEAAAEHRLAAVTFTAQPAVHHLFRIAKGVGLADEVRGALAGPVLAACIGPVCAEALVQEGVTAYVWPEPARLPAMVRLVTDRLVGVEGSET